ncbi:MAG: hypothetical protein DRJ47_01205 [Thermoprotei archaeon]|nr:MAG: hypothetical protein DRJ47_01205 [Thermoprotei archaeon]
MSQQYRVLKFILTYTLLLGFITILLISLGGDPWLENLYGPKGFEHIEEYINEQRYNRLLVTYTRINFIFMLKGRVIAVLPLYIVIDYSYYNLTKMRLIMDGGLYMVGLEEASLNLIGIGFENFTVEHIRAGNRSLDPFKVITKWFLGKPPYRFPYFQKNRLNFHGDIMFVEGKGGPVTYIVEEGYPSRFWFISPEDVSLVDWILIRFGFEDFHLYFYRGMNITYNIKVRVHVVFHRVGNGTRENPYGVWKPKIVFQILEKGEDIVIKVEDNTLIMSLGPIEQERTVVVEKAGRITRIVELERE